MTSRQTTHPTPRVSIIVPVYDGAPVLAACLDALERQTYPHDAYEVIVVDNASSEDIAGVCRDYGHARYVYEGRPGSYAARNTGIAAASSEILAFTDADCVPAREWLERGVARLLGTPGAGIVGGAIQVFAVDEDRPTMVESYEKVLAFPQRQYVEVNHWAATANMFTRREVMRQVGCFETSRRSGGDAEWGRRAHRAGYGLVFAHDAVVRHPARRTFGQVVRKERRVAGGMAEMIADQNRSIGYFAYYLARMTYYALRKNVALVMGRELMKRDMRSIPLRERVRAALVLDVVTAVRVVELLRLRVSRGRGALR